MEASIKKKKKLLFKTPLCQLDSLYWNDSRVIVVDCSATSEPSRKAMLVR